MCSTRAKKYCVEFQFNGTTVSKRSDSVSEAIDAVKPDQLHTEMFITASTGDAVSERRLNLVQGKKLFADEVYREIFINNLLLT